MVYCPCNNCPMGGAAAAGVRHILRSCGNSFVFKKKQMGQMGQLAEKTEVNECWVNGHTTLTSTQRKQG